MNELEGVIIGEKCLSCRHGDMSNIELEGECLIRSCKKLREITIGSQSFCHYGQLVLNRLPSLESLTVASLCFSKNVTFSLKSLWYSRIRTRSLFTSDAFHRRLLISKLSTCSNWEYVCKDPNKLDLPQLQSVTLGNSAFQGDGNNHGPISSKTTTPIYLNSLVLKSKGHWWSWTLRFASSYWDKGERKQFQVLWFSISGK